jgi:hypothetical protein
MGLFLFIFFHITCLALVSTPGACLVPSGCPDWVCPGVASCERCLCLVDLCSCYFISIGMSDKSDTDTIFCFNMYHVIQDGSDWQPGVINLLMIQDRSLSLGYCRLQVLKPDFPLPIRRYKTEPSLCTVFRRDRHGRVLLKNSLLSHQMHSGPHERLERHWPAFIKYKIMLMSMISLLPFPVQHDRYTQDNGCTNKVSINGF